MSDLAPFVAAAIRDKVVQDLQEENARLRAELVEQKQQFVVEDALNGFFGVHRIAITGPPPGVVGESPLVYAIEHISIDRGNIQVVGTNFDTINDCTLQDLRQAQLYVNGNCFGALNPIELKFCFNVGAGEEDAEITSIDDVLDPDSERDYASFVLAVQDSHPRSRLGAIWFGLDGVQKEKMLAFAGIDFNDIMANPINVEVGRVTQIDDLIDFFGAETPVIFEMADDIS